MLGVEKIGGVSHTTRNHANAMTSTATMRFGFAGAAPSRSGNSPHRRANVSSSAPSATLSQATTPPGQSTLTSTEPRLVQAIRMRMIVTRPSTRKALSLLVLVSESWAEFTAAPSVCHLPHQDSQIRQ